MTVPWKLLFDALVRAEAAEARVEELQKALTCIAFMRPAGPTPKLVKGELIEQIEKIALAALSKGADK